MNTSKGNSKRTKRNYKITRPIEKYICGYVLRKVNFNCNKLIYLINKKYDISISKSSIYKILKKIISKKKFIINWC